MSMTPGPWRYSEIGGQTWLEGGDDKYGRPQTVFHVDPYGNHMPSDADAQLIAAAPDLLAAAKAKLADCGGCKDAALMEGECCSNECAALATAIEKAEGRNV